MPHAAPDDIAVAIDALPDSFSDGTGSAQKSGADAVVAVAAVAATAPGSDGADSAARALTRWRKAND